MTTFMATPLDQQKLHACSVRVRSPAMIRGDYFVDKAKVGETRKRRNIYIYI